MLLTISTVDDMQTLIHASPALYRQYMENQNEWDWRTLRLELGPVLIDAHTVAWCNNQAFRDFARTPDQRDRFLEHYKYNLDNLPVFSDTLPRREILDRMVAFHVQVIVPLMDHYVAWCRSNVPGLTQPRALSLAEQTRIMRGLYRFQLFCNLFGCSREGQRPWDTSPELHGDGILETFLAMYEPWEVKEILCINMWADDYWRELLPEVRPRALSLGFDSPGNGSHRSHGTFIEFNTGEMSLLPSLHFCSDINFAKDDLPYFRRGLISRGLAPMAASITFRDDLVRLVAMVDRNMFPLRGTWLEEAVTIPAQRRLRFMAYSARHLASDEGERFGFDVDHPDALEPPHAWARLFNGTYHYVFGDYIVPGLRWFGYVMWDFDRFERALASEGLMWS